MPSCRLSCGGPALSLLPVLKSVMTVPSCTGRADPVDVAQHGGPFELELEVLLDRERRLVAVGVEPVLQHVTRVPACGTPPTRHSEGNSCGRQRWSQHLDRSARGSLAISPRSTSSMMRVHGLAHPGVVAAGPAEAELVAQHVHELARLQVGQPRVRDADRLVQRSSGVGPVALEPPPSGIDAERHQAVERGEASPAGQAGVGELRAASWPRLRAWTPVPRTVRRAPVPTRRLGTNRDLLDTASASEAGCGRRRRAPRDGDARATTMSNSRRSSSSRVAVALGVRDGVDRARRDRTSARGARGWGSSPR